MSFGLTRRNTTKKVFTVQALAYTLLGKNLFVMLYFLRVGIIVRDNSLSCKSIKKLFTTKYFLLKNFFLSLSSDIYVCHFCASHLYSIYGKKKQFSSKSSRKKSKWFRIKKVNSNYK